MKNFYFYFLMALLFSSCGQKGKDNPSNSSNTGIESNPSEEQQLNCLEENTGFLKNRPIDVTAFVEVIAESSSKCKASKNEVKKYAEKIIKEYGDF